MDVLAAVAQALGRIDLRAVVDIFIVTVGVYWLLSLISGTTAATLVRGILLLFIIGFALSNAFQLTMLGWLLRNAIPALLVAVPILFAPELRRALEQVGRAGSILPRSPVHSTGERVSDIVATAARQLAERRWGGLIVFERDIPLGEYASSGIEIDGVLSVELLLNVFYPNSPLHDGAVIVRGDRVLAAGVVLPLSESATIGHMGTRHRAAIGITERTNAISVVVSEETGALSIANAGRMVRNLGEPRLRKVLAILLERTPPSGPAKPWRRPWTTREADGAI